MDKQEDSMKKRIIGNLIIIIGFALVFFIGVNIPKNTNLTYVDISSEKVKEPIKNLYRIDLYSYGNKINSYQTNNDYICYTSNCSIISFLTIDGKLIRWQGEYLVEKLPTL